MRQRTGHVMLGVLIGIALSQTMVAGAHTESALHSKLKSLTNTLKNVSSRVSSLEGSMSLVKSDVSAVKASVELIKIAELGPLKSKKQDGPVWQLHGDDPL